MLPGDVDAWAPSGALVRELDPDNTFELEMLTGLHLAELPGEYLNRFGPRFLAAFYRAFASSPHAAALVAVDRREGIPVGLLIGVFDRRAHYRHLVRRHGPELAAAVAARAIRRPAFGLELLRTRAVRYLRGAWRLLLGTPIPARETAPPHAEVTYLAVAEPYRRRGIGQRLIAVFAFLALENGLDGLELRTLEGDVGASTFYDATGWQRAGRILGRDGRVYKRYRRDLAENGEDHGE